MIPAKTKQSTKSDKPSGAPASNRKPKQQNVNTAPKHDSAPAAAKGSGDPGRAAPGGPKPPVTSPAKKTANVSCPVTTDKNPAPQDSPIAEKSSGDKGRPTLAPPRPETLPLGTDVKLEGQVVEAVELQTRGQRENPQWFAYRQNRITASAAHQISHSRFVNGKSKTPAASYLAAITGQRANVKTRAMTWGIENEAEAVRRYARLKSASLGRPVEVRDCGLFIDPQHPWLAASPDGIVEELTGRRLLTLEVKCPYKHRNDTVAQACLNDRAFCLELLDGAEERGPRYRLKPNHGYYTQIQCQMAVTGLHQADLAVFTLKETAIVPVAFDPEFWENTLAKLELFYTDAVLPVVKGPAVKPEG